MIRPLACVAVGAAIGSLLTASLAEAGKKAGQKGLPVAVAGTEPDGGMRFDAWVCGPYASPATGEYRDPARVMEHGYCESHPAIRVDERGFVSGLTPELVEALKEEMRDHGRLPRTDGGAP